MNRFLFVNFLLIVVIFYPILAKSVETSNAFKAQEKQSATLTKLIHDDSKSRKDKKDTIEKIHSDFGKKLITSLRPEKSDSLKLANLLIAMQLWHRNRDFASAQIEMRMVNTIGKQAFWRFIPLEIWTAVRAQLWLKSKTFFAHQTGYAYEESLKNAVIVNLNDKMKSKIDAIGNEIKDIFHKNLLLNAQIKADMDNNLIKLLNPMTEDQLDFKHSLEIASDYIKFLSQILHFELYNTVEFKSLSVRFAEEIQQNMNTEDIRKSINAFEVIQNEDKYRPDNAYVKFQMDVFKSLLK